jgi:hypothetical protein
VTVLSAARLTRLMVADDFPPVKFFRDLAYDWLDKGPKRRQWQIITWCAYCAAFWVVGPIVAWGYLTDWQTAWWLFNGALAASYLASIVVRFDGDKGDES